MDTRYLFKRYNTWWVKVAVPRTLRNQLGYDLRQSLKTHNLEEAQDLRWEVIDSLKHKIEETKNSSLEDHNLQEVLQTLVTHSTIIKLLTVSMPALPTQMYLNT